VAGSRNIEMKLIPENPKKSVIGEKPCYREEEVVGSNPPYTGWM
jgi:hypothetical protein